MSPDMRDRVEGPRAVRAVAIALALVAPFWVAIFWAVTR